MRAVAINEYAAYTDEQGGADGADATARERAVLNMEIGSRIKLITGPSYSIACRLESREENFFGVFGPPAASGQPASTTSPNPD